MSTTLTYFAFDGSRGLECRLALALAGVPFEDVRLTREQWLAIKADTPFGAMPVLTVDGRRLAQSNAILGYIGRTHGLLPTDPWTCAEHEALMASVEDLRYKLPNTPGMSDDEKKTAREAFAAGWLTQWAGTVSERVVGPFVEGASPGVVGVKLYVILRSILSNTYDHVAASMFDAYPKLLALRAAVEGLPAIAAYFGAR